MKFIFVILMLFSVAYGQTVGEFRYDTTKFRKVGGRNHVIIENLIQISDSTSKPLAVGTDGVIKRMTFWPGSGGTSGGNTNSNIGTGYRWAIPNTNNVKTYIAENGLTNDSISHANTITTKLGGHLIDNTDIIGDGFDFSVSSLGTGLQLTGGSNTTIGDINNSSSGNTLAIHGNTGFAEFDNPSHNTRLGINTNSPDSTLHLVGGLHTTGGVRFTGIPSGVGTKQLRINAAGEVTTADTTITSTFNDSTDKYQVPNLMQYSGTGNAYFYGNSIVRGALTTSRFSNIFCNLTGLTQFNYGVDGRTLEKQSPFNPLGGGALTDNLSDIPTKGVNDKLVVISIGDNDIGANYTNYNATNFKAAYDTVIQNTLSKGWKPREILIMSPSWMTQTGYNTYGSALGVTPPTLARQMAFIQGAKEISQKYNCLFLDMYYSMKNNGDSTMLNTDGVHPLAYGDTIMANAMYNYLNGSIYAKAGTSSTGNVTSSGGAANYFPIYTGANSITASTLLNDGAGHTAIGTNLLNSAFNLSGSTLGEQSLSVGSNSAFYYQFGRNPVSGYFNFIGTNTFSSAFLGYTFDYKMGIGNNTPSEMLDVTGNIKASGTITPSDFRYKKNINPILNSLSAILALKPSTYEYDLNKFPNKGFNEGKQFGLIAQDVEKVIPELVKTYADGYKGVNYTELIPVLIAAIQEQQHQIDELKKQLNLKK